MKSEEFDRLLFGLSKLGGAGFELRFGCGDDILFVYFDEELCDFMIDDLVKSGWDVLDGYAMFRFF